MKLKITRSMWSPTSYQNFKQYLSYFHHTNPVFTKLREQTPVVSVQKIIKARQLIAECEDGKSALLHLGDCAEPFQHAQAHILQNKIDFLKKCENILSKTKNKPATIFGRIAGQYAKPRSTQFVEKNGIMIHNYKGDNINSISEDHRDPCVNRLYKGYELSSNSAKLIYEQYPELFTSHEGLVLPYQQSLTREYEKKYYCQSAHMIWIGQRTRQLDGAHVEFFRGIQNPIGVKVSSNISEEQFISLVKTLNPKNQKGRLLVIIRMGKDKIKKKFQNLVNIKQNQGFNFLFVTDPMHGNTFDSKLSGVKTRSLEHIVEQIKFFEDKLKEKKLNYGYSLEATYQNVTQCFGLKHPVNQSQISKQTFKSKCDPRLNRDQTLHLLGLLSP